ncbi:MAG: hypothetical protein IJ222_07320 [Bacteroidales bacterium]|nr:hypothetical protein [Bacteroidales bacterium]
MFFCGTCQKILNFAALLCTIGLFAQTSKLPNVKELVSVENENTGETVEVVNIPVDGVNRYFLHVGNMGIGDKVIQVNLDPVYRLYIPLGNNLADAVAAMEELKTLYKEPKGTMREVQGSFKPFFPTEETETVRVYRHQPLLANQLQFVIERDGYERVAYLSKSEFGSLLRGLKLNGKLHKE